MSASPCALPLARPSALRGMVSGCQPHRRTGRRLLICGSAADGAGGDGPGRRSLRVTVGSLLGQAGTAVQGLWERLQQQQQAQRPAAAAAAPAEVAAASDAPSAAQAAAATGSVQLEGQSQVLTFRSEDGSSGSDGSQAAEAAPLVVQVSATGSSDGGSSGSADDGAALLLSWDGAATGGAGGSQSSGDESDTGWAAPEPPTGAPWKLAGNVLFGVLLAAVGVGTALVVQQYGTWRQRHPLGPATIVGNVAVPAAALGEEGDAHAAQEPPHGGGGGGGAAPASQPADSHAEEHGGLREGAHNPDHSAADGDWATAEATTEAGSEHLSGTIGAASTAGGSHEALESAQQAGHEPPPGELAEQAPHESQQASREQEHGCEPVPASSHAAHAAAVARKFPIRTPEGAAALQRMRQLQQRRQRLYERLDQQQEQRWRQGGEDSTEPAAHDQAQHGAAHAAELDGSPAPPEQAEGQRPQGQALAAADGAHDRAVDLGWLRSELELEERQDAATVAPTPPRRMASKAMRQRAAAAHRAATAAARQAHLAAAAFSTAADSAAAAARAAQRAAAAAARADAAVERRVAAEAVQAAAQAAAAASEGTVAARTAAVASAKAVVAQHDAGKLAQTAASAADLAAPHTAREWVVAAWQQARLIATTATSTTAQAASNVAGSGLAVTRAARDLLHGALVASRATVHAAGEGAHTALATLLGAVKDGMVAARSRLPRGPAA